MADIRRCDGCGTLIENGHDFVRILVYNRASMIADEEPEVKLDYCDKCARDVRLPGYAIPRALHSVRGSGDDTPTK
jgi:hypothetical protein